MLGMCSSRMLYRRPLEENVLFIEIYFKIDSIYVLKFILKKLQSTFFLHTRPILSALLQSLFWALHSVGLCSASCKKCEFLTNVKFILNQPEKFKNIKTNYVRRPTGWKYSREKKLSG